MIRKSLQCFTAILMLSGYQAVSDTPEIVEDPNLHVRIELLDVGREDASFVDGELLWSHDHELESGESIDHAYRDEDSGRTYSVNLKISVPVETTDPGQEVRLESIWTAPNGESRAARFLIDGEFGMTIFFDSRSGRQIYLRVLPKILWDSVPQHGLPSYDINAHLDLKARAIRASATLSFPAQDPMIVSDVAIDLVAPEEDTQAPYLRLETLRIGGKTWKIDDLDRRNNGVLLPEEWREEGSFTIEYSIPLEDEIRRDLGYDAFFSTQPYNSWYPRVMNSDGVTPRFWDFDVSLTAPTDLRFLCTGREIERQLLDGGATRRRYQASRVEGFALNFSEEWELVEVVWDDLKVLAFAPPSLHDVFHDAAELTGQAAEWYRELYGFFPSQQIGIVSAHPSYAGGFPASGIYYLHLGNLEPEFLAKITAHELAHTFWGQHVVSSNERELDWLMLGLGIWVDQLYLADLHSRNLAEQWREGEWLRHFVSTQTTGQERRLGISSREEEALDFDYNTRVRHAKGAIGIWLLSQQVGVEAFVELQRQLLADFAFKPLPPDELGRRLAELGVTHAEEFLRQWMRGDAEFGYEIESVENNENEQSFAYDVVIARTGTLDWPVPIVLRSESGRAFTQTTSGRGVKEHLHFVLDAPFAEAALDPDGALPLANSGHLQMREIFRRARLLQVVK